MKYICLDYDGTYTDFPFIMKAIRDTVEETYPNTKVILCTMRYEHEKDEGLIFLEKTMDVYYSGRVAKAKYLWDNYMIRPDLWVDDFPRFIIQDAK